VRPCRRDRPFRVRTPSRIIGGMRENHWSRGVCVAQYDTRGERAFALRPKTISE
jgi:hypothetical protein